MVPSDIAAQGVPPPDPQHDPDTARRALVPDVDGTRPARPAHPGRRFGPESLRTALRSGYAGLDRAHPGDLTLRNGKMVLDVNPKHADRGPAIAALLREPPFAARHSEVLTACDDVTDADGIRTVNAAGGRSRRVGGPPRPGPGATGAR
jgi:trehalose-phosphatase